MPVKGISDVKKMISDNKKQANKDIRAVYLSGLTSIIKATPVEEGEPEIIGF